VLYNDDTGNKILPLIKERMENDDDFSRKGMFTSAILSAVGRRKTVLFFNNRNHAEENLVNVLAKRQLGLDPPI
jgi:transposase